MSELTIPEYALIGSAFLNGWIVVDLFANLLLMKKKKGCRLRFIGARWLRRNQAIAIAFLQFGIAFGISFFINDFFSRLFLRAFEYIIPIGLGTIGVLYLYILGTLPYDITPKRCAPSIVLFVFSGLVFFLIQLLNNGFIG